MTTPYFLLTVAPLNLAEIYALVEAPTHGAIVVMSGMVRNHTGGRGVAYLAYEAYEPMALEVFSRIAQTAQERFAPIGQVAIHHRLGQLSVGTISVLVAVGAAHRDRAFEACRFTIDTLKTEAPIWKKECWEDGTMDWVGT